MSKKRKAAIVEEEPTADFTPEIVVTEAVEPLVETEMQKWLREAPVAESFLTQQWYGETFVPSYTKWLQRGRELAK